MASDKFFDEVDKDVFIASAEKLNVSVRYANTNQGQTTPNGYSTFKVDVPSEISCSTNQGYGFQRWAAFAKIPSGLTYQNQETYESKFKDLELDSSIVEFKDAESETTEVTIHKNTTVFLVPICSQWLEYRASVPKEGASNVVKNSSINIGFSSAVKNDTANFTENIKILQGETGLYADSTDITDWFEMTLSENGLILTCKIKDTSINTYTAGEQITVKISEGLEGANKNTFAKAREFSFVAGSGTDDYAPEIKAFSAGIASAYSTITSVDYTATHGALSTYATKRAKDKVNIYVRSTDKTSATSDEEESNVLNVRVRSSLVIGADGAEITSPAVEKTDTNQYSPAKSFVSGIANPTNGTVFAYDISSGGEDGLVRIDVATVDNNGNANGFDEGSKNAYKSLFVVRDNTPPDITTEKSKVKLQSTGAEYNWFNETTLQTVSATLAATTPTDNDYIQDGGENANLRAPYTAMQWAFTLGSDASAWTPEESEWASATSPKTLTTDSATEGSSDVLMALRDDVGNVSDVAKLDFKLNYDKTAPTLGVLSWLNDTGAKVNVVTKETTINEYLAIPFTETRSGIREIDIQCDGASVIDGDTEFFYSATGNFNTKTELGTRAGENGAYSVLKFTPAAGSQVQGYTSGTLYVKGVKLGSNTQGERVLTVNLNDAALNETPDAKTASVYFDDVKPQLHKVVIPNVTPAKYYGESASRYYVGEEELNAGKATVQLYITEETSGIQIVDFTGSTIKPNSSSTVKMIVGATETPITDFTVTGGDIKFTNIGEVKAASQFILEITNCSIENIAPANSEVNTIKIKVTDFANQDSLEVGGGTYSAGGSDVPYSELLANKAAPLAVAIGDLADRGTSDYTVEFAAEDGFTNYEVVNATVTIPAKTVNSAATKKIVLTGATFVNDGSTHNGLSNKTVVTISSGAVAGATFTYTVDGDTIEFTDAFATEVELTLSNIKLTGDDGEKTVKATAKAPSGSSSAASAATTITLDRIKPQTTGAVSYSGAEENYPRKESDIVPTYGVTLTTGGIPYFYTSGAKRKFDVIDRETASVYKKIDDNEYFIKISKTATTAADIYADASAIDTFTDGKTQIEVEAQDPASASPYSYIIYDVAGNCSEVKQFHLIKDNSVPDKIKYSGSDYTLSTRMVLKAPRGAGTHRNPAVDNVKNYVIKAPLDATNAYKYKIIIKLNGIATGDIRVDGTSLTAGAANTAHYGEIKTSETQSGLGAWAITKNGAAVTDDDWKTTFEDNGDISFYINDYLEAGVPTSLTLYLKDNCGNVTSGIKIGDGTADDIAWTIGGGAPSIKTLAAASTSTSLVVGTSGTGAVFGRTYVNGAKTYFNDNAYLGVTYNASEYLFGTENSGHSATNPASGYSVKARLYFTTTATAPDDEAITGASTGSTTAVSDWYYFADDASTGDRTFYVQYPHLAEGTEGTLYILLEDTIGNTTVQKVENGSADKFCYNNTPTQVTPAANLVLSGEGTSAVIDSTKYIVYGKSAIPQKFNITIAPSKSGICKYKYSVDSNDTDDAGYTESDTVDKIIPVSLLEEASASATAKPIYLYIYDNVGNLSKTKLGTNWLKDSTAPAATGWTSGTEYSNITQSGTSGSMVIMIPASSTSDYTALIPKAWFTDNHGSGVKGLLESSSAALGSDLEDGDNFKLTIPYDIYKETGGAHGGTYYVYDNVGNKSETAYTYTTIVDSTPPTVGLSFSVTDEYLYSTGLTLATGNQAASLAQTNTSNTSVSAPKLWSSDETVSLIITASDTNGIASIKVGADESTSVTSKTVSLTATTTETTHTVVVTDKAGNKTTLYFKLQLDNAKPSLECTGFYKNTSKTALESKYYYPKTSIASESTVFFKGENAFPIFEASDGDGVGLEGIYLKGSASPLEDNYYETSSYGTELTFVARDLLKNEKEFTLTIKKDAGVPTISTPKLNDKNDYVHLDGNTLYYNSDKTLAGNLTFTASDADGGSGLSVENGFFGSNDDSLTAVPDSQTLSASFSLTDTAEFVNNNFYTFDNVGNISGAYPITFTADITPPDVTGISIVSTGGSLGNGYVDETIDGNRTVSFNDSVTVFTVTITASDTGGSGIKSYACDNANFVPDATNKNIFTIDTSKITASATVTFTVTDNVGNETDEIITFTKATTGPVIDYEIVSAVGGTEGKGYHLNSNTFYFTDNVTKVTFKVTSDTSGLTYSYNGAALVATNTTEFTPANNATLTIVAKDKIGNSSNEISILFAKDEAVPAAPSIASITPGTGNVSPASGWTSGSTVYFKDSVAVEFNSITDTGSGFKGIYNWDTSSGTGTLGSKLTLDDKTISTGKTLSVVSVDNVGNYSDPFTITFVKDTGDPTISLGTVTGNVLGSYDWDSGSKTLRFNASADTTKKVTSITITLTVGDTGSAGLEGSSSITSTLGGSATPVSGSDGVYEFTAPLSDGDTSVTITVTDKVGNFKTETITLVPDGTPPELSAVSVSGEGGSYDSGAQKFTITDSTKAATITVTATDASGIYSVSDGTTAFTAGASNTYTLPISAPAAGTVTITAKDKAGNETTTSVTFAASGG